MSIEDEIRHHEQRAMQELDVGLEARSIAASSAHLRLSSLHLMRARELQAMQPARTRLLSEAL